MDNFVSQFDHGIQSGCHPHLGEHLCQQILKAFMLSWFLDGQKTTEEMRDGYGFSDQVACFYAANLDRFMVLRAARDAVAHGGKSPGFVFKLPRGFGINGNSLVGRVLKRGNLWVDLKPNENDLGSCLALLALLTKDLFDVLADVTRALTESITNLPVETAPGYRVFARSQLSAHRIAIPTYLNEPWRMDAGLAQPALS